MGVVKRQEEQMKKILARSKQAAKKEAEDKIKAKKAAKGKGKLTSKNQPGELSLEEKKALRAKYSHMVTAEERGPVSSVEEPPYRYEVHSRRQTITLTVTLHKIPHQFIDVDSTTKRKFVLDTTKFSKKFRLEFPFPDGMLVEVDKADYTLDSGVLTCVFPIDNMPKSIAEENEKMLDKMRAERKMRFKYDQNGELNVRTRKAKLAVPPSEKKSNRGKRSRDDDEDAEEVEDVEGGSKNNKKAKSAAAKKPTSSTTTSAAAPSKSQDPKKNAVSDDAMSKLIKETAKAASQATQKKQIEAKVRNAKADQRNLQRDAKAETKKERMSQSFASLVSKQKQRLEERRAMAAPVLPSHHGKSVHFA